MPTKVHTVICTVDLICANKEPLSEAPQKFAVKFSHLNAPARMIARIAKIIGITLTITTNIFSPTAAFTPRYTSQVSAQMKAEATTADARLFPSPKTGKKFPSAANSSATKVTCASTALIQ